ncbi:methyltransferase domain-containing protein [Planococcus sp. YIM B11945]|uniref:class I SAM-dependent methyltransferase n=1 Tax=Planococcus sp. YIM B11945 TaxID=3435410 RepID=UPI003D7E311E
MKEHVKEIFNQLAAIYENSVDATSLYNSEYERPAMMAELPRDLSGMNVFDAGCAAGWYTEQLADRCATVTAVDLSPEMVEAAKRRVGERADVLCLDLENELPFQAESFDLILSSLTLHYLPDWNGAFAEFRRVLKPGGILLFSVHHPFTDIRLLQTPAYFSIEPIIDRWNKEGKEFDVPFYRRPLSGILNTVLKQFTLEKVIEPQPTASFKERYREGFERLMAGPQFIIIKATKN